MATNPLAALTETLGAAHTQLTDAVAQFAAEDAQYATEKAAAQESGEPLPVAPDALVRHHSGMALTFVTYATNAVNDMAARLGPPTPEPVIGAEVI